MNCRVVVEAAVPVYDVSNADEAVRIAISKTGEMLNPDLNYVEISQGSRTSPSGEELPPAFIAADEALVALELEMTVYNVEREEHAERIARKEIGQRMQDIPLSIVEVEVIEEDADETETDTSAPETDDGAETVNEEERGRTDDDEEERQRTGDDEEERPRTDDDEEVLPEFEDLID
ncbi:hypothetical protein BRD17_05975 [Halobacteriales archaeon SW_7_68_16]|nr:MAG: hypothetical protein BRD17_05975 [Halobacteriales archaeon SW_7_68_16]